jgi:hypothetical protein
MFDLKASFYFRRLKVAVVTFGPKNIFTNLLEWWNKESRILKDKNLINKSSEVF